MGSPNQDKPIKIFTVSEITRVIKQKLESLVPLLWVEGEISDFKRAHSGHLYFTLKDKECQIRAVMWKSSAQNVPFDLDNGLQVVCRGQINVYEPRGIYQLQVNVIEPKGKGALQLAFEQLKEKLQKEGLFDPGRKKRLPLLPKKVGIVTSPRGAAIVDIIRTLERRFARLHILIYPVKVQGEGAAEEIVEGIEILSRMPGIDVIIVGRGGGSLEDLWAFNEEKVARALFNCPVPVISAIGHEIDFTIADFIADIRASTPSAAAEMVIEKEESFLDRIKYLENRMIHGFQFFVQSRRHHISQFIRHDAFQSFKLRLMTLKQRVDELETETWEFLRKSQHTIRERRSRLILFEEKIKSKTKSLLRELTGRWEKLSSELHNLSPLNILKKGYALCWKGNGQGLIRRIEDIEVRENVIVSLYKGEFGCEVKNIDREKLIESSLIKEKK